MVTCNATWNGPGTLTAATVMLAWSNPAGSAGSVTAPLGHDPPDAPHQERGVLDCVMVYEPTASGLLHVEVQGPFWSSRKLSSASIHVAAAARFWLPRACAIPNSSPPSAESTRMPSRAVDMTVSMLVNPRWPRGDRPGCMGWLIGTSRSLCSTGS